MGPSRTKDQRGRPVRCSLWFLSAEEFPLILSLRCGAGKHYCAGKVLQSPDEGGPTIEQEIQAGGKLGEV
jgi:hypothetical protein